MGIQRSQFWFAIQMFLLIQLQTNVFGYEYKVGDLNAWNEPSSANPHIYTQWPKKHNFKIGDSLLFLYPPSQDSVIQVTQQSYNSCNLTDPILYMNNGNSLFNITTPGVFYFASGEPGHCQKSQKLQISVLSGNGSSAFPPSEGPSSSLPDSAPSYPTVFGGIPAPPSSSPVAFKVSMAMSSVIGVLICALVSGKI